MMAGNQEAKERVPDDDVGTCASKVKRERIFPLDLPAPVLPGTVEADVVMEWYCEAPGPVDVTTVSEPAENAETEEGEKVVNEKSEVTRRSWTKESEEPSRERGRKFTIERAPIANNVGAKTRNVRGGAKDVVTEVQKGGGKGREERKKRVGGAR